MNNKAKIIKLAELSVKIVILLFGILILYKKLIINQNVTDIIADIEDSFKNKSQFALMLLAIFFVPLNLYLEAIKWKLQIKPIENISNWKSFLSIFTVPSGSLSTIYVGLQSRVTVSVNETLFALFPI